MARDIPEKITNALLELMKEKDYDSISITDIVEKAGLSRVTYYRHFNSKEDIIKRYFQLTKEKFVKQAVGNSMAENNEFMVLALFMFFKSNMEANKALRKSHLDKMLLDYLTYEFMESLPVKLDKYFAIFLAGALFNVLVHWLDNDCKDSIEEASRPFIQLQDALKEKVKA